MDLRTNKTPLFLYFLRRSNVLDSADSLSCDVWAFLDASRSERAAEPKLGQTLPTLGQLNGFPDGQRIELGDWRLAGELPPDGAVVSAAETGEPGLRARAALVVERVGYGT